MFIPMTFPSSGGPITYDLWLRCRVSTSARFWFTFTNSLLIHFLFTPYSERFLRLPRADESWDGRFFGRCAQAEEREAVHFTGRCGAACRGFGRSPSPVVVPCPWMRLEFTARTRAAKLEGLRFLRDAEALETQVKQKWNESEIREWLGSELKVN